MYADVFGYAALRDVFATEFTEGHRGDFGFFKLFSSSSLSSLSSLWLKKALWALRDGGLPLGTHGNAGFFKF